MTATAAAANTVRCRAQPCVYLPTLVVAGLTAGLVWYAVATLERQRSLGRVLAAGRAELVAPAVVALVAATVVCERLWPADGRTGVPAGLGHDAGYFLLHVVVGVPLMTLLSVSFGSLLVSHARWIELGGTGHWPRPLLFGTTMVLMDAANWLAHWADHRWAPLWRFHAVHHSQEDLNVLTSFRAHPLSHLAGFFLATVPVVVLVGDRPFAPALITGYVCLGTLAHANLRWTFGPFGYLIVSPAYHRIHHSPEGASGLNLGIVLTIWDVLAGRARFPDAAATPCPTGLPGRPIPVERSGFELRTLLAQLVEPFRASPN
jgi:hypothetical protein